MVAKKQVSTRRVVAKEPEVETEIQESTEHAVEVNHPHLGYLHPTHSYTEEQRKLVIANVPKSFQLTLDSHATVHVKAGTQRLEKYIAEHWFAKNNGVTIFPE